VARKSRKHAETAPVQVVQKPMFYAGAYIRLSVVDKKHKGDSLETQQAIINSFIADHSDIELRECYVDNGHSGKSFERPAFQRMIADMESGKINCCITKDLSRLGRNAIDSGYYMEKYFPSKDVRYIAVTDGHDSINGQSGGIMVSLKNMVNEAYILDVSRKIKATIQMNIRNGKFIGSNAPYGYFKSREDCHQLVVDEYAAPVVRQMFEMAADGQSHQSILAWLNDNKIMPPRRYMHSIGLASGKETGALTEWWSLRAVRDTLKNKVYCGVMIQGRSKVVDGVQVNLPESEWTITENAHDAIVSRELYDAVQEAWVRKSAPDEPYYKTPNTENVFARKLYCAQCGHALHRKRGGERFYRYFCNVSVMYAKDACNGVTITETAMKEMVFALIRKHEPFLTLALSQDVNNFAVSVSAGDKLKDELAAAKSELDKNNRFLAGLYQSLVDGDISDAEYKDMKGAYETRITSLTDQVMRLQDAVHNRAQQEKVLSKARASVRKIEQVSDLTAEIIDRLVEKIIVYHSGRIGVKFRFMDDVVHSSEELAEGGAGA
jgi:DNA invertase Pin-like site-specific DNA recombinase